MAENTFKGLGLEVSTSLGLFSIIALFGMGAYLQWKVLLSPLGELLIIVSAVLLIVRIAADIVERWREATRQFL